MTDREKKIAEIREKSEIGRVVQVQANTVHDLMADIRFLLSELDRVENACKTIGEDHADIVDERNELLEENKKVREERDSWQRGARRVEEEKQSAQQEIAELKASEVEKFEGLVRQIRIRDRERETLNDRLLKMAQSKDEWYVGRVSMQEYAKQILRDIGVNIDAD